MTPEERKRAGRAVRARLDEMGMSMSGFARKAGVNETTLRRIIAGQVWARQQTRDRIADALGWSRDEITRRALSTSPLGSVTTNELVAELCERFAVH